MRKAAGWALALLAGVGGAQAQEAKVTWEGAPVFQVDFSRSMQNWDNTAPAVQLTPALPLDCHWTSDTRLTCSVKGRRGATPYRLAIPAGLATQSGEVLPALQLDAATPPPEISASVQAWAHGVPQIKLWSDLKVDSAQLARRIVVAVDGAPVKVRLERVPSRADGTFHRVILPANAVARPGQLTVRILPGLPSTEGPLRGVQDAVLLKAPLHPRAALIDLECKHRGELVTAHVHAGRLVATCSPGERVVLTFSQPLDEQAQEQLLARLKPALRADDGRAIEPLKFDAVWSERAATGVEKLPQEGRFALVNDEHASTLQVRLDGTLRTQGVALDPVDLELHWDQARPQLRAPAERVLLVDAAAAPRPEAMNAPGVTYDVRGVAADAATGSVQTPADATGDRARPVSSPLTQQLLAQGGWVSWQRRKDDSPRWRRETLEFAAPGFDLDTLVGRREVLAWANAWESDAPIAGAALELLLREPEDGPLRVVARAATDIDGTALLRLPDDLVVSPRTYDRSDANPRWLLRAIRGGKRSVLPLQHASLLGTALERSAWGVTDRPLYRAGDVVRYRLWQRQVQAHRLVALPAPPTTPLPLYLVGNQAHPLLEWRQDPAADGSVHGEIRLPEHVRDGLHCVQADASAQQQGACFYVGSFRAQDLWVEVKTPGGVVRDGDALEVQVAAGYYSGGSAAGAAPDVDVEVEPVDFAVAYPAWSDYSFLDPDADEDVATLELPDAALSALDAAGQASGRWALRFGDADERPAFGRINASVEVAPQDRDATAGTDQATLYARFDRYVGLRTDPEWFGRDDVVRVQAVVVDASGQEVSDARVEVSIESVRSENDRESTAVVGRCTLRASVLAPCAFPRTHSGTYRLTARSGNAAPAVVERYVWGKDTTEESDALEPALDVQDPSPTRDRPLRLRLTQPQPHARVLLAITAGEAILGHRVQTVDNPVEALAMPVDPAWREPLIVTALVRTTPPAPREDGRRLPASVERVSANIPAATRAPVAGVTLALAPSPAAPGQKVALRIGNPGTVARTVTVAVVDDALRSQARKFLPLSQPQTWLDQVGQDYFRIEAFGFSDWDATDPWRDLLPWPGEQERADTEMSLRTRGNSGRMSFNYSGQYDESDAYTLDSIQVTGSRIRQAEVEAAAPAIIAGRESPDRSQRAPREHGNASASAMSGDWRVRGAFADTAFWLADLALAPGETRTFEITLPDNLTRWKAVAWSADAAGGFAMDEAAVESGLPVETRLQVPVRMYPGDVARLAASVRQLAGTPTQAHTALSVRGPGMQDAPRVETGELALAAAGQGSAATVVEPQSPGALDVVAYAQTPAGRDAVGARVDVASPWIAARKVQAGWLGERPRELALPALPPGATDAQLDVSVLRGQAGLARQWTHDLRDYPHRCWEQIVSRAVGAALAQERGDASWPQAGEAIDEALRNAAVFQNPDGGFRYFTDEGDGYATPDRDVPLSAWSVHALELLQSMGHAVPADVLDRARDYLAKYGVRGPVADKAGPDALTRLAYVAAARPAGGPEVQSNIPEDQAEEASTQATRRAEQLDQLWARWSDLPLPGRIAAASALARGGHPAASDAVARLLAQAPANGESRVLAMPRRFDEWMSSAMREQCALVDLLARHPALADPRAQRELMRGLGDLYAGGVASVDTQTAAVCLAALRDPQPSPRAELAVDVGVGAQAQRLVLAPQQDAVAWTAPTLASPLHLSGVTDAAPLSYVATLAYREDARTAKPSAVGFRLDRSYEVLHDGTWRALDGALLRDGDWVRVSLTLDTAAPRHFVAITDEVPGGLRPTDLALSGVATAQVARLDDVGSWAFQTRRLDPRRPRFYASYLPAGVHVVRYFARVGNGGDYLAAPAVAELMYGEATRARTAADRVRIQVPDPRTP